MDRSVRWFYSWIPTSLLLKIPENMYSNYSQNLVLKCLGSWAIRFLIKLFTEKMSQLSKKSWSLSSLPDNPFMLIHVWLVTHLSGGKGDSVFEQIDSRTVFQDELSLRTKVPLYISTTTSKLIISIPFLSLGRWTLYYLFK